jgi:hypothetical protein
VAAVIVDSDPHMDDMVNGIFAEELLELLDDIPPFLR